MAMGGHCGEKRETRAHPELLKGRDGDCLRLASVIQRVDQEESLIRLEDVLADGAQADKPDLIKNLRWRHDGTVRELRGEARILRRVAPLTAQGLSKQWGGAGIGGR